MSYTVEEDLTLPEDTIFTGVLESIIEDRVIPKEGQTFEPFTKLKWKFRVTSGEYEDKIVYGKTGSKITNNPNNPFYSWTCALLGRELEPGADLDIEDLAGLRCQFTVRHEPQKNDKKKFWVNVDEVLTAEGDDNPPF